MGKRVAIVGATGAVGLELLDVLAERDFPVDELLLYASPRSLGARLGFRGQDLVVRALDPDRPQDFERDMRGVDVAFFSAGAERSRLWAPRARAAGAVVVDNSSAFRMDPQVPLVVPEVNAGAVRAHDGLIANPNCSTAILVLALAPLHKAWPLRRCVVATYQAVSGAGRRGEEELREQSLAALEGREVAPSVFPHSIAFNLLARIGDVSLDAYTAEELKLHHETRKILGTDGLSVSATCIRVPVWRCHSEAVTVQADGPLDPAAVRRALQHAPGVTVVDDPAADAYPMPAAMVRRDGVQVGRIRADLALDGGVSLWVVGDQLRKGAATNAVQIAELL